MNTQHTPGPWHLTLGGSAVVTDDCKHVANVLPPTTLEDARLIAAAPELLATLRQIARLSREANRDRIDVASMLGDIARDTIDKKGL